MFHILDTSYAGIESQMLQHGHLIHGIELRAYAEM
jgi:hypothetical protein